MMKKQKLLSILSAVKERANMVVIRCPRCSFIMVLIEIGPGYKIYRCDKCGHILKVTTEGEIKAKWLKRVEEEHKYEANKRNI